MATKQTKPITDEEIGYWLLREILFGVATTKHDALWLLINELELSTQAAQAFLDRLGATPPTSNSNEDWLQGKMLELD